MNTLNDYIATMEPIRSAEIVRISIEKKAQQLADKLFPDDKEKNKFFTEAYQLGMFDALELAYY